MVYSTVAKINERLDFLGEYTSIASVAVAGGGDNDCACVAAMSVYGSLPLRQHTFGSWWLRLQGFDRWCHHPWMNHDRYCPCANRRRMYP